MPTQSHKRGYLWLCLLIVAVALLFLWPHIFPQPQRATDTLTDTTFAIDATNVPRSCKTYKGQHRNYPAHSSQQLYATDSNYTNPNTPHKTPLVVDINTADTLTLQLLHGIGPAYARWIVQYRERLGGFTSLKQLLEVYRFTPELLDHIAPHLTLSTDSIRRIPINSVTVKQLIRHPYIDYYQARDLIAYRDKGHRYTCPEDLLLVSTLDTITVNRLTPYLDFN